MSLRSPSMDNLIAKIRVFIGDPLGVNMVFDDEEIQDALDNRRRDVYLACLNPAPTTSPGPVTTYLSYFADVGWWEEDVKIQKSTYDTVTALTSPALAAADYVVGKWTFSASLAPPVYISGKHYDLNGAAADLLDAWLSKAKLEFDFLELGATFKASQQVDMLETAAKKYRARQWVGYSQMVRSDELPGWY